ncbi:hypothetical protein BS17DRAFT_883427, partial [Gyrodon lividus]
MSAHCSTRLEETATLGNGCLFSTNQNSHNLSIIFSAFEKVGGTPEIAETRLAINCKISNDFLNRLAVVLQVLAIRTDFMSAPTRSEIANWDGHLPRTLPQSYISSSTPSSFSPESFRAPVENQDFDDIKNAFPRGDFREQKRFEQSLVHAGLEREPFTELFTHIQLHNLAGTSSVPSDDVHSPRDRPVHTTPTHSKSLSSQLTPNSSVHVSRVHNSPVSPGAREHAALSGPAFTIEPEVIDLTLDEDTEEELSVSEMLTDSNAHPSDKHADPGPSRHHRFTHSSPPIGENRSLFTPPPVPKRRRRVFMDHIAVPSFSKGVTKADYEPMAFAMSPTEAPISHAVEYPSLADALRSAFTQIRAPATVSVSPDKRKGKERECEDVAFLSSPARKKYKPRAPATFGAGFDTTPSTLLDAFYAHAMVPLGDVDLEPPLTRTDLATNTRFQFAHTWRKHTSTLQGAELEWITRFKVLGRACTMAGPSRVSLPPIPGTAGYVMNQELRAWELVPPESSPRKRSNNEKGRTTEAAAEPANAKKRASASDVDTDPPDVAPPPPKLVHDPELSNSTILQEGDGARVDVDMDVDMNQYFNGLGDSPNKSVVSPAQHLIPTHTSRPHLLQFTGQVQLNSHVSGLPLSVDTVLAQKDGSEYFFGMPPSPTAVELEPHPLLTSLPPSPFQADDHLVSQEDNFFVVQSGSSVHTSPWSLREGGDLSKSSDSPTTPRNDASPIALSTIDPSLLCGEQLPAAQPKVATPKSRPRLPEPIIYIRRPMDSSSLPLFSGKRPVQIKFRNLPPTTNDIENDDEPISQTQTGSKGKNDSTPSSHVQNDVERSASVAEEDNTRTSSLPKRPLAPPETVKPKPKPKLALKPSRTTRKAIADSQELAPERTFCHQCRNTNVRPKMQCSNTVQDHVCGKRFCNRCILNRYPDITFDQLSADFMCPACTNTCNCSHCARKRGEEFISMRG